MVINLSLLRSLSPFIFQGNHGLEREVCRLDQSGGLGVQPHGRLYGDPLRTSGITLDFADNQLELVTQPHSSIKEALKELWQLHVHVARLLPESEFFWTFSMPPLFDAESLSKIQIADFGTSEQGKNYRHYRQTIAARHGIGRQLWTGVHYNFSFNPQIRAPLEASQVGLDEFYMGTARNFLRSCFIAVFLYGKTPWLPAAYKEHIQSHFAPTGIALPEDLSGAQNLHVNQVYGYQSYAQFNDLHLRFQSLHAYVDSVQQACVQDSSFYNALGVMPKSILLDHRELYLPVRFKNSQAQKTSKQWLEKIEYLEFRFLDIDPMAYVGVTESELYFIHLLVIVAALSKSPQFTDNEWGDILRRIDEVSLHGLGQRQSLIQRYEKEIEALFKDMQVVIDHMPVSWRSAYSKALKDGHRRLYAPDIFPYSGIQSDLIKHSKHITTILRRS